MSEAPLFFAKASTPRRNFFAIKAFSPLELRNAAEKEVGDLHKEKQPRAPVSGRESSGSNLAESDKIHKRFFTLWTAEEDQVGKFQNL